MHKFSDTVYKMVRGGFLSASKAARRITNPTVDPATHSLFATVGTPLFDHAKTLAPDQEATALGLKFIFVDMPRGMLSHDFGQFFSTDGLNEIIHHALLH